MSPKKVAKPAVQPIPAPEPPRLNREDLVKKAIDLQKKHQQGVQPNPAAAPTNVKMSVVEMKFTLSNGDIVIAEGEQADVLYRYNEECQRQCLDRGLATYDGPPLRRYTAEQWAQLQTQAKA